VNPKYDIIKFTQSYRKAERKHTFLLPALMLLVVGGSFWLVLTSKPVPVTVLNPPSFEIPEGKADASREVAIARPPKIDFGLDLEPELTRPPFSAESAIPAALPPEPVRREDIPKARVITPAAPPRLPAPARVEEEALPTVDPEATKGRFTPWMTSGQINRHFMALNQGHTIDFWDRGHWIVAVEGRWTDQGEEFRVVYEEAPRGKNYAWRYRTSQTREEFTLSMAEFKQQNYQLVQSQAYEMPDGTRRYQGVWHRVR